MIIRFINKNIEKGKLTVDKGKTREEIVTLENSELTQALSQGEESINQIEEKNENIEMRKKNLEKRILKLKKEGKKLGEKEGEDILDLYGPLNLINRIVKEKFEKLSEKTAIDLINSWFGNFVLKTSKYFPKFSKDVAKTIVNYDTKKMPFDLKRSPEMVKYELIQWMLAHINDFEDFDSEVAEYFSERWYDYIVNTYPEKFWFKKWERKKVG